MNEPEVLRPTAAPWPPFPSASPVPGKNNGSGIQQPSWKSRSPPATGGVEKTVFKIRHDMKYLRDATKMLDPQAGAELEEAAQQSWSSGQLLLDMGRRGQMKLARNRDPVMIIQTAYSLHRFDMPFYLRLEAGADSIDHFVVDIENCFSQSRNQVPL